jgi:bile acid:Na+ symporter, BASS family
VPVTERLSDWRKAWEGTHVSLEELIPIAFKTSIFLTVLGFGLRVSAREVLSMTRDRSRFGQSMLAMMVIMPVVAVFLAYSFDLHPAVKIALVALSVSPVPPFWPKQSIKFGGDEPFTLGLLVATAALAIVVIPISMEVLQRVFAVPLRMPADSIARMVLLTILLPLFLGLTVRQLVPRLAGDLARPFGKIGTWLLAASGLVILVKLWPAIVSLVGDGTLLAMTAFAVMGLAVGHFLGGTRTQERSVLALACSSRHPAIAITIAQVNFPSEKLVPAAVVLYLLVSTVVATPYMKRLGRSTRQRTRPVVAPSGPRLRAPR